MPDPAGDATERPSVVAATRVYDEYRHTALWHALAGVLRDLEASRELTVATAPDYVIGYLCQELAAKRLLAGDALTRGPDVRGAAEP